MNRETTPLQSLFEHYKDRPVVFIRPGGNAGDQLIYMGADKLGRLSGIDFTTVSFETFMETEYAPETVLYLHGGGGYNPLWSGKPMVALEKAARHRGVVIQGPQTFWNDSTWLKERVLAPIRDHSCERMVLMTRECVSYDAMREVVPAEAELFLDQDTALHLDKADLKPFLPPTRRSYTYYAIRNDVEAREQPERAYFSVWLDPVSRGQTFEHWLKLHAEAGAIITNRLHSSICGAILGTPTTLLANSYFKNRAVWERSLEAKGVRWADRLEIGGASSLVGKVGPIRDLLDRSRVKKLVRRLYGVR